MAFKWYAIVEKESGKLYATASIDSDDPDTSIYENQMYSVSGLKGIAHPDILKSKGLEAIPLDFNPQDVPTNDTDGRYEWQENERTFITISGTQIRQKRLAALQIQEQELISEMKQRGENA